MKEINESDGVVSVPKERVEVVTPAPKEYKYVGSKRLIPGLKLWGFRTKTQEFFEVEIHKEAVLNVETKQTQSKLSVEWEPHVIYHQAHNRRAALRKFRKLFANMGINVILPEK